MERTQCNNCIFNDLEFNILKQGDTITLDDKAKEYCRIFDEGIPSEILKKEHKCDYKFVEKGEN